MALHYKEYQKWFKLRFGANAVILDNLGDWLAVNCSEEIDATVREKLAQCEAEGDSDSFMPLLTPYRFKLKGTVNAILFHRWIMLMALNNLPPNIRKAVEKVAIAYLPTFHLPEAYIAATPWGHIICFSMMHTTAHLKLFQAIVASKPVRSILNPDLRVQETNILDRIINIAKLYTNTNMTIELEPIGLNESQINYADLMNNHLQLFIMLHEYGHYFLGHLDNELLPDHDPLAPLNSRTLINCYDDLYEQAADEFAATFLKRPNVTNEDITHNRLICGSLIIHFYFNALCRLVLGFESDSIEAPLTRGSLIGDFFLEGGTPIYKRFKEFSIIINALRWFQSNRH